MLVKCCVKGCKSEKYPGCKMTFHSFPSDEKLKTKWIEITNVTGNVKYKRICTLHFKNEDFTIKGNVIRLKQNVIPTFLTPPFKIDYAFNNMILKTNEINHITDNRGHENCDENGKAKKLNLDMRGDDNLQDSNYDSNSEIQSFHEKTKEAGELARCKCCLESNKLQSMWQEHCCGGLQEVYGIMLIECFALPWRRPENLKSSPDLICASCIVRLKDALSFKMEVLASQQLLSRQLETVDVDKLKQERDDVDINLQTEYEDYVALKDNDDNMDDHDEDDCRNDNNGMINDKVDKNNIAVGKEMTMKTESHHTPDDTSKASNKDEYSTRTQRTVTLRKRKQSKNVVRKMQHSVASRTMVTRYKVSRKAISDVLKSKDDLIPPGRKNLTKREIAEFENLTENLRNSVEAVQSKKMTEAKAAIAYNVPRELIVKEISKVPTFNLQKTDDCNMKDANSVKSSVLFVEITKIINDVKEDSKTDAYEVKEEERTKPKISKGKEKHLRKDSNKKKPGENRLAEMKKQANNIAIILESTNATPIRRHGGIGYGCCFCNEEFPDPCDLKKHTIKEHDMKTKRNYAKGKRPSAYLVKLDITGLKCNLCGNAIDSLEQLYDHLIEHHKKLLYRNAKNYIVPFKFDQEELRCLFCEFICNSFKGLLEHMSVHYRNHICEICDAGFLTKNNLFNHAGRHKKGTFKCDHCSKVFDTSSKKAGHQRLVHSSSNGVNRCGYCGEMFGTYRRKEKHLINEHGITLKKLKCKACDKTFETQTGLRIHTKRDHLIERRFQCSICDKRCFTNVQLMQHTLKHTGIKKFQCTICLKAYGRKSTLREHMRIHENDRRFKCELCGMAFVQKCSWRGHMLSKHGQQV